MRGAKPISDSRRATPMWLRTAFATAFAAALSLVASAGESVSMPAAPAPSELRTVFAAARDPVTSVDGGRIAYVEPGAMPEGFAPLWPLHAFLVADAQRVRGDSAGARKIYGDMVQWAGGDPYRDGTGASGLCSVALWRWLQLGADEATPEAERRALLAAGVRYWQAKGPLAQGLFTAPPILGALPQLREDILRRLVALAWSLGERQQAHRLLGEYLAVARDSMLTSTEEAVLADGEAAKALNRGKLFLALGKRLYALGKQEQARTLFLEAQRAEDATVAADARLQLAQWLRDARGRSCATPELVAEVDAVLAASADADLRQRALLFRARKYLQRDCPEDVAGYEADLKRLFAAFPGAYASIQALIDLGSFHFEHYFDDGDRAALDSALARFGEARALLTSAAGEEAARLASTSPRIQERLGLAWFRPALALYARGTAADKRRARELLQALDERWPDGPLRLNARFWRGRIAAETSHRKEAREQLQRVIDDSPYDYYAIRARMHLELGEKARQAIALSSKIRRDLAARFRSSEGGKVAFADPSAYHSRLQAALGQGIYQTVLTSYFNLRKEAFPGHALEDVTLQDLDASGRLLDVVVTLALRQDAIAAADRPSGAANRLRVARTVGEWSSPAWLRGDWPLAVFLSAPRSATGELRRGLQQDIRFLAAAYPNAYEGFIAQSAAQWKVRPELLYAVIRTETIFNPVTESSSAALGLFQFIPSTFRGLNTKWHLVDGTDTGTIESFLLSPETNIRLGARWFAEDLLEGQDGNVLWALMAHNAGPTAVARWKPMWRRLGRSDDVEFMVETARFEETRGFAQRALTTLWIADAAGKRDDGQAAHVSDIGQ